MSRSVRVPSLPWHAIAFLALLVIPWIVGGAVVIVTYLPTFIWPREIPVTPRSAVRFYVGGVIIVSGVLMLYGISARRRIPAAIGSSLALGISAMFMLGLIRLIARDAYLWPQILIAWGLWLILTAGFVASLVENRRLVPSPPRAR